MGYECSIDRSSGQINKKVRNAQLAQWNYILVAGEDEMAAGLVDVRTRDNVRHGKMRVDALHTHLESLKPKESASFNEFYGNMWTPEQYPEVAAKVAEAVEEVKKAEEEQEQKAE
jgi:histidyl-tRNA synthetase